MPRVFIEDASGLESGGIPAFFKHSDQSFKLFISFLCGVGGSSNSSGSVPPAAVPDDAVVVEPR